MARRSSPSARRPSAKATSKRKVILVGAAAAGGSIVLALVVAAWVASRPLRLAREATAAARAHDWETAARAWHDYNQTDRAEAQSFDDEARAWLAVGCALRADLALRRAIAAAPNRPEPWLLLLEMFRVEDRPIDAIHEGTLAFEAVPEASRRSILRAMTLAILADTPEDLARTTLARWAEADPSDLDARVAFLRKVAASPRPDDPDRSSRIADLDRIVRDHPDHLDAREVLVMALAESGDPPGGRAVLDAWPEPRRDARYLRLLGRWELEFEKRPDRAIEPLSRALEALPHDWRTRYRLARAFRALGRESEAQAASEAVQRLRETLDPVTLGPRLDADLARLDDPKSRLDLADLCGRAGLDRLARAWRRDAVTDESAGKTPGGGGLRDAPAPR